MTRRFPLLVITGANFLLGLSVATTHDSSPALAVWTQYLPYEWLLGAFLFSGVTGLRWLTSLKPSERRLILYFIGSMLGFSAYTILLFTYAVATGSPSGIVLILTLYIFIVWDFAEGRIG